MSEKHLSRFFRRKGAIIPSQTHTQNYPINTSQLSIFSASCRVIFLMFFLENEGAVFGSGMKALSCVYSALMGPRCDHHMT